MFRDLITKVDGAMDTSIGKYLAKMDLAEIGPFGQYISALDCDRIGSCVLKGARITQDYGNTATAICKRRFKWEEMVVMVVLDEDEEGEAGIVFTEKGIYHWMEDEEFVAEVLYEDIGAISYCKDEIIITKMDDSPVILFCGEDAEEEKYSRYMYNFICDVVDYFDKHVKDTSVADTGITEVNTETE
jgi:hypothetical protein